MSLKNIRLNKNWNSIGIYVIALSVVILLVVVSFFYKSSNQTIFDYFPLKESNAEKSGPILYLFIFFTKHNCRACLEVIPVLNDLPPEEIKVVGVIPDEEMKEERKIRQMVSAAFEIEGQSEYKKYIPLYSPSIVGVSTTGKIFFVLPLISELKDYLFDYIMAFQNKILSRDVR